MFPGLCLLILFHVNLTGLAVYALDFKVRLQVGLLHLEQHKTAG